MAFTKYKEQGAAAKARRKEAGQYVKSLRLEADMTQRELANILGLDYYTFISQVESGAARVPPESILAWASALNTDSAPFARRLLRHYDPHMHDAIFSGRMTKDLKPTRSVTLKKTKVSTAKKANGCR